jgi:phage/plasmid-like protein (TIGR03299 family)
MAYFGDLPWHKLGIKVDHPMTSQEAIIAAQLDDEVEVTDCYQYVPEGDSGKYLSVPDKYLVRRVRDNAVYNCVSSRYVPIQNVEAFKLFDSVVGGNFAMYHTVGSLFNGARIWILAKINDVIHMPDSDIEKYLLLINSHDGSDALSMFFTPVRVVCNNTLRSACASGNANRFYAKHTTNIMSKVRDAQDILGITNKFFLAFEEQVKYLATHMLPPAQAPLLLAESFGLKEQGLKMEELYKPVKEDMEFISELAHGQGKGISGQGTKYDWYNAITEYTDHYKTYRIGKSDLSDSKRMNAVLFGSGNAIKERAFSYLLKD